MNIFTVQFRPRSRPSRGHPFRRGQGRGWQTPDYKLHPDRWTEYSLEDVDISDSSNKQAAFSFLEERRALRDSDMKESSVELDSNACSKGLITFKKPVKKSQKSETANSEGNAIVVEQNDFNLTEDSDDIVMEESQGTVLESQDTVSESQGTVSESQDTVSESQGTMSESQDIVSESQDIVSDLARNLKRKANTVEADDEEMGASQNEKSVGFKSRKIARKNIRSRQRMDDDSD